MAPDRRREGPVSAPVGGMWGNHLTRIEERFLPNFRERARAREFEPAREMLDFDRLYSDRADFVYSLCYRLEGDIEKAERLFADVWKLVNQNLEDAEQGETDVSILLCSLLARSHRRLGRTSSGESNTPTPELALVRLFPEYRLPLVLRETGGLSYAGIASALDLPEATVRARLARARALLRTGQASGAV